MKRKYLPLEKFHRRALKRAANLPKSATLKYFLQGVDFLPYDQGQEGSCTANSFCAAFALTRKITGGNVINPSRQYFYYYERLAEQPQHDPSQLTDSGADVCDGCAVVKQKGICPESDWPYEQLTNYNTPPSNNFLADAAENKIANYQTIPYTMIKQMIVAQKPVMTAIAVYESFESAEVAQTGLVPIPKSSEQCLGGHEVLIIGYNDNTQLYTVLNSWGESWGLSGLFHLPYAYISNPNLGMEFTVLNF